MKYEVVSIRDLKGGFINLGLERDDESAMRSFGYNVNVQDSFMRYCPEDFQLFHVANFDSEKGVIEPVIPIELICTALDVKEK